MNIIWQLLKWPFEVISNFFKFIFGKAENIHYLALTVAIMVGGLWTLYTFDALKMKSQAEQDLKNAQSELSKVELELKDLQDKIDGTDSSFIQIRTQQFQHSSDKFGLIINVMVQNTGTNDVDMTWTDSPLQVFSVESRNGDEQRLVHELKPEIYDGITANGNKSVLENLYLFVGAKKELSFFVELNKDGLYYVLFKAKINGKVVEKMEDLNKNGVWFSSKYVYVYPPKTPELETYIKASTVFEK
ncbi:hypothetical protein [Vibrio parahaemolyticus]|uniref:hypothetical protein n=1 Tax=Vibrio parahaemolyticus TaxID=670 RepID=UPI000988DBAD|nr:hypothetical protein [Vibrio parahaemolyticus]EGQ7846786.1 hypothetical protein [Vibrio parahaemolyticus]EGR3263145.1 hypothetical protein [Vibrio parahaemolyticus]EGX6073225.1 hypothetical protein [Vibrio parahaemolyticus]EID0721635.1 hypothetical protein [Vibrio parahaemolyticus]EJG1584277.1 hypothetical protein [Vibrio parahaemolyticus]